MESRIDEKLRILQPIIGPQKAFRLKQMYVYEEDFRKKSEIESYMDILITKHSKRNVDETIILPPPSQDLCGGEIPMGIIQYLEKSLYPFNLNTRNINRHMGVFGATGSGKTTFATHLLRELHKRGIPFLVFDWEKSYRNLVKEFDDVQVFTVGKDINPLFLNFLNVPPGIDYDEYIKSVIAIISEDYIGGIGADTMLLNYMEQAFQETGSPFFEDLKHIVLREIQKDKGRKGKLSGRSGLWKESVSRQITFMSKGAAGRVVNSRKHYPLEKLFSKPIVLEFGNLKSPYDRKFFIHVILNWLSIYNQHRGIESEKLKQVLVFEEFHNIAMKGKEDNMVSTLFRESRKYSSGLIAIDQTPSEIPNAIFANMNTKVSFALGTRRDISAMAKAMNLEGFKDSYLGMLETGQAVIQVKQRFHDPFLIRTPFVQSRGNISDEELRQAMGKFAEVSEPDRAGSDNSGIVHFSQNPDTFSPLERIEKLEPLEKVVLTSIIENPLDGVDKRTRKLGVHPSSMSQIHDSLTQKGLVKPVVIDRKKLFELTESGLNAAQENKIPIPKRETRGGLEHTYWIAETVRFMKKHGFQPFCEENDIDIVDKTSSIAIEVETGKSDIGKNILKLEKSRISNCFMLATQIPVAVKLKTLSHKHPSIHFLYIKDFFKLAKDQISNKLIS